jgi:hypothetical protein
VDAASGIVTVLDPEIRKPGASFHVVAGQKSFGSYPDTNLLRKLLGE